MFLGKEPELGKSLISFPLLESQWWRKVLNELPLAPLSRGQAEVSLSSCLVTEQRS